jgi:hypothetical protein
MSVPRRLLIFLFFLCLSPLPEEHRAEATASVTLIQGPLEPGRRALPGKYSIALADNQEETAQSAAEKTAGEEQTPKAEPAPVGEKPPRETKSTSKTITPRSPAGASPTSPSRTPGSSLAPQKAAPPARAAPKSLLPSAKTDDDAAPSPQPASLIRLLEGREDELMLWLAIAFTFFIIGWICGGNFYLRRERKRSRKLRF